MTRALNDYTSIPPDWLANVEHKLALFLTQAEKTYQQDAQGLDWIKLSTDFARNALIGYAAGEMTFQETLQAVATMSGLCPPSARTLLLGIVADRALNTVPKYLGESKPLIPRWLRASLGEQIDRGMVEEGLTQTEATDRVLKLIDRWGFAALLKKKPTAKTLQDWHRDWKRATGSPLKPGRPRKPT